MFEIGQEVFILWDDIVVKGKIIDWFGHTGCSDIWKVGYGVNSVTNLPESMLRSTTPESVFKLKQEIQAQITTYSNKITSLRFMLRVIE